MGQQQGHYQGYDAGYNKGYYTTINPDGADCEEGGESAEDAAAREAAHAAALAVITDAAAIAAGEASETIDGLEDDIADVETLIAAVPPLACSETAYMWATDDCSGKIGYVVPGLHTSGNYLMRVTNEQLGDFDNTSKSVKIPDGY